MMRVVTGARASLATAFAMMGAAVSAGAQSKAPIAAPDKLDSPFAAFRLGAALSPVASVDGGLDVTFPRLRLGAAWVTRADVDISARFNSASFGSRRDAELALSLCQVYTPGGVNRGRLFLGGGIGTSFGPQSGLSGKLFVGTNLSQVISIEAEAQFPPRSGVRAVLMLRLSAL